MLLIHMLLAVVLSRELLLDGGLGHMILMAVQFANAVYTTIDIYLCRFTSF